MSRDVLTQTKETNYFFCFIKLFKWGRGGSLVVSVLVFLSDNPSPNPAEAYQQSFCKICV